MMALRQEKELAEEHVNAVRCKERQLKEVKFFLKQLSKLLTQDVLQTLGLLLIHGQYYFRVLLHVQMARLGILVNQVLEHLRLPRHISSSNPPFSNELLINITDKKVRDNKNRIFYKNKNIKQ